MSALQWDSSEPVVFRKLPPEASAGEKSKIFLNPNYGNDDATACITRFTLAVPTNKKHPVEVRLLDKVSLLKTLVAASAWRERAPRLSMQTITAALKENAVALSEGSCDDWADFLSILNYAVKTDRIRNPQKQQDSADMDDWLRDIHRQNEVPGDLLGKTFKKCFLNTEDEPLWDFYKKACTVLDTYKHFKTIRCSYDVARRLIDMQAHSQAKQSERPRRKVSPGDITKFMAVTDADRSLITIGAGNSGERSFPTIEDFAVFQSLVRELVISINEETLANAANNDNNTASGALLRLLKKSDVLDFPGVSIREGQGDIYARELKLGKTLSSVHISAFDLVDDFCLMVRMGDDANRDSHARQLLGTYVNAWKAERLTRDKFVTGFTFIDSGITGDAAENMECEFAKQCTKAIGAADGALNKALSEFCFVHAMSVDKNADKLMGMRLGELKTYLAADNPKYADEREAVNNAYPNAGLEKVLDKTGKERDTRSDLLDRLADKINCGRIREDIEMAQLRKADIIRGCLGKLRHTGDSQRDAEFEAKCQAIATTLPTSINRHCEEDETETRIQNVTNTVFELARVEPSSLPKITLHFYTSTKNEEINVVNRYTRTALDTLVDSKKSTWGTPEKLRQLASAFGMTVEQLEQLTFVDKFFELLRYSLAAKGGRATEAGLLFVQFIRDEQLPFREDVERNPAECAPKGIIICEHLALKIEDYLTGRIGLNGVPVNLEFKDAPDGGRTAVLGDEVLPDLNESPYYAVVKRFFTRIRDIGNLKLSQDPVQPGDVEIGMILDELPSSAGPAA